MTKADEYEKNADNCRDLGERATNLPDKARYARMEKAWRDLAQTQQWLDGTPAPSSPLKDSSDMRN